jgi:hypothetical protein
VVRFLVVSAVLPVLAACGSPANAVDAGSTVRRCDAGTARAGIDGGLRIGSLNDITSAPQLLCFEPGDSFRLELTSPNVANLTVASEDGALLLAPFRKDESLSTQTLEAGARWEAWVALGFESAGVVLSKSASEAGSTTVRLLIGGSAVGRSEVSPLPDGGSGSWVIPPQPAASIAPVWTAPIPGVWPTFTYSLGEMQFLDGTFFDSCFTTPVGYHFYAARLPAGNYRLVDSSEAGPLFDTVLSANGNQVFEVALGDGRATSRPFTLATEAEVRIGVALTARSSFLPTMSKSFAGPSCQFGGDDAVPAQYLRVARLAILPQ